MGKNLIVAMSGGTTTVINGTLAGIVKAAQSSPAVGRIYAGCSGIQGILEARVADLTGLTEACLERIKDTPGSSIIGTSRIAPLDESAYEKLEASFERLGIGFFINIGGNGTLQQSRAIAQRFAGSIAVAAAPKTVDNDLGDPGFEKVYFTPGFPSCVNYWIRRMELLNLENLGAQTHDQILVAQTFGRETGFLAGCVRAADPGHSWPLAILLPEDPRPMDMILGHLDGLLSKHGRAMVVVSEGYPVGDVGERFDARGQVMFGSSRTTAAQSIVNACMDAGMQARSFLPTIEQRQAVDDRLRFDLELAEAVGRFAVAELASGRVDFLASIQADQPGTPLTAIPFGVTEGYSRIMPPAWVDTGRFDVTDAYVRYLQSFFAYSSYEKDYQHFGDRFEPPLM